MRSAPMRLLAIVALLLLRIVIAEEPVKPPAPPPGWGDPEPSQTPIVRTVVKTAKTSETEAGSDAPDKIPSFENSVLSDLKKHPQERTSMGSIKVSFDDHVELWVAFDGKIVVLIQMHENISGLQNMRLLWSRRWKELNMGITRGERGLQRFADEAMEAVDGAASSKEVEAAGLRQINTRQSVWTKGLYFEYRCTIYHDETVFEMEMKPVEPSGSFDKLASKLKRVEKDVSKE